MVRAAQVAAIFGVAAALMSCSDPPAAPAPVYDAGVPRRVFDPPPGEVRAVPPFAVAADGVGPYAIGARLEEVLDLVPRGPRIELLRIDGVAEFNLVRSENGALLVGAPPKGAVAYVAVLEADIAKTVDGIEVGASAAALHASLVTPRRDLRRAADPRVVEFATLRGVRFVVDGGRVLTMLIAPTSASETGDERAICREGGERASEDDASVEAVHADRTARVSYGCVTGETPDAIVAWDDGVALVSGEPAKPKRVAALRVPGLLYAAALDADGDGVDEIAVVSWQEESDRRIAKVDIYQWSGTKLVPRLSESPYEVSRRGAAWTGAQVNEVELLIVVQAFEERVRIGGIYLHSVSGRPREVAPLSERTYSLEPKRDVKPTKPKATKTEPPEPEPPVPAPRKKADPAPAQPKEPT